MRTTYSVRVLRPADYREERWANGLGTTTQLAIYPPYAVNRHQDFLWRVSRAPVTEDGAWSRYPNYLRIVMLLSGRGVLLDHGADGKTLVSDLLSPHFIDGAWSTHARLVDGVPMEDINLFVRRGAVGGMMDAYFPREPLWYELQFDFHLFHCVAGSVAGHLASTGKRFALAARETLLLEAPPVEPRVPEHLVMHGSADAVVIGIVTYLSDNPPPRRGRPARS